MAKKNPEEIFVEEDFSNDSDDIIVEMTDEEGNKYYYVEEMVIPVDDENFAILIEIPDHEHDEDCDCDEEVIIAKIVVNEDGEEEYIEPTDEEFEAVQEAYERLTEEEE